MSYSPISMVSQDISTTNTSRLLLVAHSTTSLANTNEEKLVRSLYDPGGLLRISEGPGGFYCLIIKQALEGIWGPPGPFSTLLDFSVFNPRFGFANRPLRPLGYATPKGRDLKSVEV